MSAMGNAWISCECPAKKYMIYSSMWIFEYFPIIPSNWLEIGWSASHHSVTEDTNWPAPTGTDAKRNWCMRNKQTNEEDEQINRRNEPTETNLNEFDKKRLGLSSADAHRLPLEHVESFRQFDGLRVPLAFFGDRRPAGVVIAGHALAHLVLCLELEDGVIIRVLINVVDAPGIVQTHRVRQRCDARTPREGDVVPSSLPFWSGILGNNNTSV